MNPTLVSVFLTLALSILTVPAGAQGACTTRCALVIGNSDYERADGKLDLTNPRNDAEAMTALFEDLGFAVMGGAPLLDADQRQMQRAFQNFADFSSGADLAVVYYAGHGQSAVVSEGVGESYLIPTDAQMIDDKDLEIEAVSLDWAVSKLEDNVDALVLFLDACRDFNVSGRGGASDFRGIGAPKISNATLVSYAAQIGARAADGDGVNSPYATALLNHLPTPGRSIRSVLGLVQEEVVQTTNGVQRPDSTDLLGAREVYFAGETLSAPLEDATRPEVESTASMTYSQCLSQQARAVAQESLTLLDEVIEGCGRFDEILGEAKQQMASLISAEIELEARLEEIGRFERENLPAMVWIPGGSFMMGSPSDEPKRYSWEGPQRRIELSGFHMSATEITVGQFKAFVDATGHDMGSSCWVWESDWVLKEGAHWRSPGFTQGMNDPVVCVSYEDAQEFVAWVNRNTDGGYALPSEAQWEYAARAGTTTAYSTGGSISSSQANFDLNVDATTPVGSYAPNAWGLYDMHGNVWEWTQDCWADNLSSHPSSGGANRSGDCSKRVLRGGSWGYEPWFLRSADRDWSSTSERSGTFGFRLLKTY